MRPIRVDLDGFAVFREPTTVDFTDTDFFALVGPTGSGKSTVLDAICFALYGTVPRWGDRRAIANALAPSATEAKVRLVFESAGVKYVLTRVVRRDGKGNVATRHAGLEALPAGFDVSKFDTGLSTEDIGEVLAGTPAEVDAAVQEVIGLPYEQFTKCVVLPQGEFAAFLHAKPAERQRILVNLLGLDVYGRIREQATAVAATAEARLVATDRVLDGLVDADDDALAAAVDRVSVLRTLAVEIDRVVPELAGARRASADAGARLAAVDAEIDRLAGIAVPADVATVAAQATGARDAVADAAGAVTAAEEREEKLRSELAAAGDVAALRRLLDGYAERERLAAQAAQGHAMITAAEGEHGRAAAALADAQRAATDATRALEAAREAYQAGLNADRAAALRQHLQAGDDCPVCHQPVPLLTDGPHRSEVAALKAAGDLARVAADKAHGIAAERDSVVRQLEKSLAAAKGQLDQLDARLSEVEARLAGAPQPVAIKRDLAAIDKLQRSLEAAAVEVRKAREAHRRAATAAERSAERLRAAWRAFDTARDGLATLAPPPADRDDLTLAWRGLVDWAVSEVDRRRTARGAAADEVSSAAAAVASVETRLATLFRDAAVQPSGDPAKAVAVAVERAEAAQRRVEERRAEAQALREQRGAYERESQVAKALAQHLRADRFERWLLAEALDSLVDGASRILRELSGGQYDLGHDKGEFFVVDHHDAGLRRAVRTLSGGETFQASLALALALSEQLVGMSSAAASLESIVLDEGFGTLDATTLDTVAATLENLAARGDRMVGVVTHVGLLADRVPVRFEVRRDARTARVERVGQ
jgi:exonuclease SbcC